MSKDKLKTEALVKLLKNGDIMAFDTLYGQFSERLYGFVLKFIKQKEDAEGVVQEVFIKVWESRNKINEYSSFESFLFTIAYNSTMSLFRKRVSQQNYLSHLKNIQIIDEAANTISEIEYNELNDKIQSLIEQLTPRQQEIFKFSREEGLTHADIAEKLHISTNTVKNQLVTALKFLKNNIDSNFFIKLLFFSLFF